MTKATLSRCQTDSVLFLIIKPVREPDFMSKRLYTYPTVQPTPEETLAPKCEQACHSYDVAVDRRANSSAIFIALGK
jgi:hypothetical protein